MKEQIKIDVPEGKIPVMEQTENGVVITWKERELTYTDIVVKLAGSPKNVVGFSKRIAYDATSTNSFYRKVEVLRKLTNIRNYFGKPSKSNDYGWVVGDDGVAHKAAIEYPHLPIFAKKEHVEQAIKMLGDELKCFFEPW